MRTQFDGHQIGEFAGVHHIARVERPNGVAAEVHRSFVLGRVVA
jgi:hypothetical protein